MRGAESMTGRLASAAHAHVLHSLQHRHLDVTVAPAKPVSPLPTRQWQFPQGPWLMWQYGCCHEYAKLSPEIMALWTVDTISAASSLVCSRTWVSQTKILYRLSHARVSKLVSLQGPCFYRDGDGTNSSQGPESTVPDSLPVSGADTDWREFRARLIRSQTASTSGREAEEVRI